MTKKKLIITLVTIFVSLILFSILNPMVIIRAGQRGVVLKWGAVSDIVLNEGIHWVTPISQSVEKINITICKEEKEASASSKDLQNVSTKITINYRLDPLKVNKIYQTLKHEYSDKVIAPAIQEFLKKTTAQYTAEELITKREVVKDDLRKSLGENLKINNIILLDIFITDFAFSKSFNEAIEAKVTAEQNALQSKNVLQQIKYEAEQKVVTAEAIARSIKIQAEAIQQQGGENYVKLQAINKWNGVLPTQMIPNASVPFLSLNQK